MRSYRVFALILCLTLALPAFATSRTSAKKHSSRTLSSSKKSHAHSSRTSHSSKSTKKGKHSKAVKKTHWKAHSQQRIDDDRTRQIQEALIKAKYLDGEPSGEWDSRTKDALVRLQAENGWQTKRVPDSRALIKLGLGPSRSTASLLNGESVEEPPAITTDNGNQNPK